VSNPHPSTKGKTVTKKDPNLHQAHSNPKLSHKKQPLKESSDGNNHPLHFGVTPSLRLKLNAQGQWQGGVSDSAGDFCFSGDLLALFELLAEQNTQKNQKGGALNSQELSLKLKKKLKSHFDHSPSPTELPQLLKDLCETGLIFKTKGNSDDLKVTSTIQDGFGDPWVQWAMVADAARCEGYERAIASAIKAISKKANVVDVGCGKGYLSAAALKHGAEKVWAIEETSASNNVKKLLQNLKLPFAAPRFFLQNTHSSASPLPPPKEFPTHLVVSELFGNDPFQEGVIPTLRDVFLRLLPQKPLAIPKSVEVFFEFCELGQTPVTQRIAFLYQKLAQQKENTFSSSLQSDFLSAFMKNEVFDDLSFALHLSSNQILNRSEGHSILKCALDPPSSLSPKVVHKEIQLPKSFIKSVQNGGIWVGLIWFRVHLWPGLSLSNHPHEQDVCEHWSPILLPMTSIHAEQKMDLTASIKCGLNKEENRVWLSLNSTFCKLSRKS
jgi:16S rRNA G966 N2-methylase RsmD